MLNVGNKIKELRKKRGITQEQLAESIGVSFQAVSKWENSIALPDIALVPSLASYFGVSLDTLFDFNSEKVNEDALAIAKESWKYRGEDNAKAREILEVGLKKYPDHEILLNNLLYVLDDNDDILRVASKIIDGATDMGAKYDACRFMSYAYIDKGDVESALKANDMIPELYITHLSERACILKGQKGWEDERLRAAETEFRSSFHNLVTMLLIMSECYLEKEERDKAIDSCQEMLQMLDVAKCDSRWDNYRNHANRLIKEANS